MQRLVEPFLYLTRKRYETVKLNDFATVKNITVFGIAYLGISQKNLQFHFNTDSTGGPIPVPTSKANKSSPRGEERRRRRERRDEDEEFSALPDFHRPRGGAPNVLG